MTRVRRWCLVALAAVVLVVGPVAIRSLPAGADGTSAPALLQQARGSFDGSWAGQVETVGTLQLPDATGFGSLAALFGERTHLRMWWRDADHWRVDRLLVAGEVDLFHDGPTTLEWDYERAQATMSREPEIRLPRAIDLTPPVLARRLLSGVVDGDVSRLPTRRLAGRSAPGLRVKTQSALSSIDHVDLWMDAASGVPLQVEVFARGATTPDFTSRFTDFTTQSPSSDILSFLPTPDMDVKYDDVLDIADAANQYAPLLAPAVVAGLPKSPSSDRAVGVYGRGATQLIAIPLRDREADALRTQMMLTPGVEQDSERTVVELGPLGVLVTGSRGDGGWLLAGTLTRTALEAAGLDVRAGAVYVGGGG